jgi:hypothetical protein
LIIFSLIFISLILLIFLFIYLYNNYSNFKTLNDFEKDSNEDTSEEEDITEEETELTEGISEEDSTVLENVTESSIQQTLFQLLLIGGTILMRYLRQREMEMIYLY